MSETRLLFVKSESLPDWFLIERHEDPGMHREWMKPEDGSFSFQDSARISDACVEGTLEEMKDLAAAIRARTTTSYRRCAVKCCPHSVEFWSPRNSRERGVATVEAADELATQIETYSE